MVNKHFFGAITRWQRASLQCATDPVPPTVAECKVADLWDDNNGWKWEIFADRIPQTYRKIIASHNLRGGREFEDQLVWNDSSSDGFSIASALNIIWPTDAEIMDPLWDIIWKSVAPQRVRMFLWLVVHDRVMTNVNRMHRNLTDPSCRKCGMGEETTIHLLWDCEAAKRIWEQLVPAKHHTTFFTLQLLDWMTLNLKQPKANNHKWPTTFATTVWWLWQWRKIRCFETQTLNQGVHVILYWSGVGK